MFFQCSLIEQNAVAQDNILKALVDTYAQFTNSRRYLQELINKRNTTITALITSYDSYDDLLAKANKGIEFYGKLETNVSKLLQRIKSACKVQEEERDQLLAKSNIGKSNSSIPTSTAAPKLKDYLDSMKKEVNVANMELNSMPYPVAPYPGGTINLPSDQAWPPGVRPAPLGSEMTNDTVLPNSNEQVCHPRKNSLNSTVPTQIHAETNMSYLQNVGTNSLYAYNQRSNNTYNYDIQQPYPADQQVGQIGNAIR